VGGASGAAQEGHQPCLDGICGSGALGLLHATDLAPRRRSTPAHWSAKVTVAQVRLIRADDTRTQVQLAARYGVTRLTISNIKHGKTWRNVV
jgi:hypothetical protein